MEAEAPIGAGVVNFFDGKLLMPIGDSLLNKCNMKYEVLFIQGAGEETIAIEEPIVNMLHKSLGPDFRIRHPKMPDAGNPRYNEWKECIRQEIKAAAMPVILLGHALGGSILLKLFSQEPVPENVSGIILFGVPFWGAEDWKFEEFEIDEQSCSRLRKVQHICLLHSRDDEQIPYAHLEMYQRALPDVRVKTLSGIDHSYSGAVVEIKDAIMAFVDESSDTISEIR
jgi:predicted alpha/beta hydrolase family esterase